MTSPAEQMRAAAAKIARRRADGFHTGECERSHIEYDTGAFVCSNRGSCSCLEREEEAEAIAEAIEALLPIVAAPRSDANEIIAVLEQARDALMVAERLHVELGAFVKKPSDIVLAINFVLAGMRTPRSDGADGLLETMAKALEPFAKAAEHFDPDKGDDVWDALGISIKIGALRKASAALDAYRTAHKEQVT